VDAAYLRDGQGHLYIGFHIDPLYHAHWNDLVQPVQWRIETPTGISVTLSSGNGIQMSQASDDNPREFLVRLEGTNQPHPLRLTVDYAVCSDEAGWCKVVRHAYEIQLQVDADGGWAPSRPPDAVERKG
jgi:hypothetical protein